MDSSICKQINISNETKQTWPADISHKLALPASSEHLSSSSHHPPPSTRTPLDFGSRPNKRASISPFVDSFKSSFFGCASSFFLPCSSKAGTTAMARGSPLLPPRRRTHKHTNEGCHVVKDGHGGSFWVSVQSVLL